MAVYGSKYSVKISPLNSRRKPSGIEEEPVETSEPYKKCVGHTFHRIPLDLETLAGGDRLIKDKSLLQKLNSPQRRLLEKAQNLLFNSRFQFPGSTPPGFSGNLPGSLSSGAPGSSSVGFPGSVPGGPGGVPPNPKALKDLFGKDKHLFTPLVADILELDHQSFRDLYGAESFCEDQADTKTINAYQASILSGIQNRFLPDLSAAYTNYSKSRASTLGDRSVEEDQADTKTISAHQASIASRLLNQFLPDPDRTHSDFNSSRASTLYEPTVEQLHEPDPNCETELYHKHCVPDWPPQVFEKSLSVASKSKTGSVYSKSKTGSVAKSDAKSATKSKSSLSNKSKSSTNTIVAPNVTVHDCLDSDTEPNQPEPVVPSGNEGTGSASESAFGTGDSSTAGGDQSDFDLDLNPNPYQEYQPPGRPLRGFGACSGCGRFACRGCCLPPPPCCPCAGPAPFPTRRNIYCFPPPPPSEFGFAEMPPKKSNIPSRGRTSAPRGPGRGSGRGRGRGRGSAGPNQSQGAPPSIIETPPEDVMGDPEADDQQEEGEEEERGDRGDPQGQMVPANQGRGQDGDQGQEKGQGQGQGQMQPCNCPLASCCRPVEPPPRIGERFFASHDLNDLWHYISHYTPASTCRSGTTCCSSSPPRSICGPVSNPCCDTQCVPKMMVQERTQLVYDQIQNVKSIIHNIRQNVLENNCSSIGSSCAPSHAGSCCPCPGGAGCCPCPGGGGGGCCGNSCRTPGGTITCYDQTGIHAMSTDRDSFTTIGDSDRFKCNYPCGTLPCDCKTNCWRPQTVYCPPQNPGFYPSAGSFCYPSCYQSRYINLPPPCCDAGEGCMCPAASKGDQKRGNSGAGPTVMFGNSNPFGPQKSSSVSLSPDESVPVDDDSMAGDDNRGPSPDHAGGSLSPGGTKRGRGRGTRGGGRGRGSMKTPSVRGRISIRGSFQSRNPAFAPNATRPTKISERYSHPMGEQAHDDDFYGSYEFNSRDGDGPGNEGGNQRGRGSGRGSGFDYPPARVSTRGQGRMTTDYQRGVFSSRPQGQSNAPPPNGFLASRDPYASVQNNAENLGFDPEFEDGPEPERPQSASPGPGQKFSSNAGATPRFTTPPARGVGSRGTRGARGRGPGRGIPGSPASRFSSPGARGSSRPGSQQGQSRGVPGGNMAAGSMVRGSMARGGNMSGGNMSGRGMSRGGTMARGGSMNRGGSTSRGGSVAGGSVAGGSVAGGSMAGGSMVDESMGRGSKIEGNRSPFGQPGGSQMHGSVFEEDPAADDFQGGPGGSESFGGGPGRGRYGGGSTRGSMRGGSVRGSLMGSRVSASRGSVGGPGRGGSVAAGRGSMAGESPMGSMAYNSGGSRMSGYQDGPQSDPRISGFSGSQDEEGEGESSMGYRPYLNKQYKQYNVQYEHPHFDPSGDRYFNEDLALPLDDLASYGAEGDVVTILPKDSQIDAKLVDNMRFPSKTKKGLKKMWAKRRNELMIKSLNIDCGPLGGKPTRTSELRASYIAAKEYVPMSPGVDTSVKAYRGPIDYNTSFTRMRKYIASEKPNKSTESASPENPRVKRNSNSILKKGQARKKTKTKKVRSNIAAANVNLGFVAKGRKVMDSFHRILKNPASIPSRDSVQPKMRSVRFDSATCETFSNMLSVPTQYPNLDAIEKAREIAARHNLSKATAEVKLGVMSPIKSHRSSTARSHQTDSSDSELIVTEFREVMEIKPQLEKPKLCSLPEVLPHKASEKSNVFAQGDF